MYLTLAKLKTDLRTVLTRCYTSLTVPVPYDTRRPRICSASAAADVISEVILADMLDIADL